jgi:DNA-binding response OmpR family regulator
LIRRARFRHSKLLAIVTTFSRALQVAYGVAKASRGPARVVGSIYVMRTDPTPAIMDAMRRRPRILVVEDDPTVSDVVVRYLEREGFDVESVADGPAALESAGATTPDLMVLDLMLPGLDGLEVFRRVRSLAPVPVIMLTARGDECDRVMGLELGADDYVGKPFSPRELTARVKSVLRRVDGGSSTGRGGANAILTAGDLEVDVTSHEARRGDRPVTLTVREFDLLVYFMEHPRHLFRREELLERVWGYTFGDTSTVTVHVRRLREKIEDDPSSPVRIQTVWGVGYRFEP